MSKTAVLLLNLGGPDSLKAVKPFLYNLFSDPDIFDIMSIRLPRWVQSPLAWLISTLREKSTVEYYQLIGGRSPILPLTQVQAQALEKRLQDLDSPLPVYIGMRYWHPFLEDTLKQMHRDGVTDVIALPLYPQYSLTTTGSSIQELGRLMRQQQRSLPIHLVHHYHDHPAYQAALAARVEAALDTKPWTCPRDQVMILFSAHSLPVKFVEKTRDVYPAQIRETTELLMTTHFPNNPWHLCYQSRIGNIPWLEPYTDDALADFAQKKLDNILMVPVSFVSDHIETLYEIDRLYIPLAHKRGIRNCHRIESLNDQPEFIDALAQLVYAQVKTGASV